MTRPRHQNTLIIAVMIVCIVLLALGSVVFSSIEKQVPLEKNQPWPQDAIIPFYSQRTSHQLSQDFKVSNPVLGTLLTFPEEKNRMHLSILPDTNQWGTDNALSIRYPVEGNFDARVKVLFDPKTYHQYAILGVVSIEDPNIWLRISRAYSEGYDVVNAQVSIDNTRLTLESVPYRPDTVYLRIVRNENVFILSYSQNGSDWQPITYYDAFIIEEMVLVYLGAYSTSDNGVEVEFYDFTVIIQD